MANKIQYIDNVSGDHVFPVTHERGVLDSNGVMLETKLSRLDQGLAPLVATGIKTKSVDPTALAVRNYSIDPATGKYSTNTAYKHSIFAVEPGQVVRVTAQETDVASVSFFKTDAEPVADETPDYSSAYESIYRILVDENTSKDFITPSDAHWCYLYRGNSSSTPAYQYTPAAISIAMSTLDPDGTLADVVSTDAASAGLVSDAVFDGAEYDAESIDLTAVNSQALSIGTSNTFNSTGTNGRIPVDPDDVLKVVGGGGRAAFVSGIYCPNSGSTVGAIETYTLESGKTYTFRAPASAVAFVYNITEGESTVTPFSITKYTIVGKMKELRAIPTARWIPSGGTLTYGANTSNKNYLFRLQAGHSYMFKVSGANASVSGVLLSELPYIGESYTTGIVNLDQSYHQGNDCFPGYTPENDCYILFRLYKSSSPSYTVSAFDMTYAATPLADAKDIDNTMSWWRLNRNAFTIRSRGILPVDGLYNASTSYKHILLPVTEGQYIKVVKGTSNARLAWLTQQDTTSDHGEPSYVPGTRVFDTAGGIFRVPAGANYLFIYLGASPYNAWPSYIAYSLDYSEMPAVVKDHDYLNTRRLLYQFNHLTRYEITNSYKPLVLLHYSDIHGSQVCQNRINEYREFWKDYITDTIQTGDLMTSHWGDGSAFGDESDPETNPSKDILSVIGNHDTASYSGGSFSWHTYQGKQSYDRYIGPYVSNWGVEQPEDAEENGYCFYYKDYSASNIRLIVIDAFNTDETYQAEQLNWFSNILTDSKENGLSVIIASHFRIKCESLLACPFTKPDSAIENPDSSGFNDPFLALAKNFIDAGGELVCWITGHSHYDAISKTSAAKGSQINVCVSLANRYGQDSNDLYKQNSLIGLDFDDWATFDLFNIMAVDTVYKTISLFRVGSNWDKLGRRVETCCINYSTKELIYP